MEKKVVVLKILGSWILGARLLETDEEVEIVPINSSNMSRNTCPLCDGDLDDEKVCPTCELNWKSNNNPEGLDEAILKRISIKS